MDDKILEILKEIQSDIKDLKTQISENLQISKALERVNVKNKIDTSTSNNPIDNIKEIIKSELSQVSYDTWIAECEGVIKDDILTWYTPNTFTQDILDKRYLKLILNACKLLELGINEVKILVK